MKGPSKTQAFPLDSTWMDCYFWREFQGKTVWENLHITFFQKPRLAICQSLPILDKLIFSLQQVCLIISKINWFSYTENIFLKVLLIFNNFTLMSIFISLGNLYRSVGLFLCRYRNFSITFSSNIFLPFPSVLSPTSVVFIFVVIIVFCLFL